MQDPKPAAAPGPLVEALREQAPDIMAELMRSFIRAKDLNSRARVRMQMKAMLDLFSTDTEWPPVPALNDAQRMAQGDFGEVMGLPARRAQYQPYPGMVPVRPPGPVPRAAQAEALRDAVGEAVVDAEPGVGVLPAPGAAVAEVDQ